LQAPPFGDLARWNKRVTTNILYYQTNYFTCMLAMLLFFASHSRDELVWGLGMVVLATAVVLCMLTKRAEIVEVGD